MALSDDQHEALLGLLRGASPAHLQQALELIEALDDPDLWAELEAAFAIQPDGRIQIGAPYGDVVSSDDIWPLVLRLLRRHDRLASLRALDLEAMEVGSLAALTPCKALKTLRLATTEFDNDPTPLAALTGLEELEFDWEDEMPDIDFLAGLTQMRRLKIASCAKLTDISAVARMAKLETLSVYGCKALADLSPLAGLVALRELDLSETAVSDLGPLAGLRALERLVLTDCERLTTLLPLTAVSSLKTLELCRADVPAGELGVLRAALPGCRLVVG